MILYWVKRGLGFVHIHKTAANLLKAWLLFNKQNREFIGLGVIPLFFFAYVGMFYHNKNYSNYKLPINSSKNSYFCSFVMSSSLSLASFSTALNPASLNSLNITWPFSDA